MTSLFDLDQGAESKMSRPLADRIRPQQISDIVGQDHLLGEEGALTRKLNAGSIGSLVFWGPPGTGKTTLAQLIAQQTQQHFEQISAIFSGVSDLKKVFEVAKIRHRDGIETLLFVDEIHRFNKAQQDSFLPVLEDGTITLIGATTENPSFELNAALLSRAQVLTFKPLDEKALQNLVHRAYEIERRRYNLDDEVLNALTRMADGDGRSVLSFIEDIWRIADEQKQITLDQLEQIIQQRAPRYDKSGDGHYNLISALHKSVRGSDPDASLYYLARMLSAGEDPMYLARRLVRMAVEDIGLADPHALVQANAAKDAFHLLGSPEGELALAQATVYLATAPKSNAVYVAYKSSMRSAKKTGSLMPPKHILNAPTKLMRQEGYGNGYAYDHEAEDGFSGQNYFPDSMERETYYTPYERGFEREIHKRLQYWQKLRSERQN